MPLLSHSDTFCCSGFITGVENGWFSAVIDSDSENGVIALGGRKLGDEISCYHCKVSHVWVCSDEEEVRP